MDGHAVKIKDRRCKSAAIGVPRNRLVKDSIGFFEITVAIAEHRHRQCAAAKLLPKTLLSNAPYISSSPSTGVTGELLTQEPWRCGIRGLQVLSASRAGSLTEVRLSREIRV